MTKEASAIGRAEATTGAERPAPRGADRIALSVWVLLILVAALWGRWLNAAGVRIQLKTPPLLGYGYQFRLGPAVLPAAIVGAGAVVFGTRLAGRLTWRRLVWVSFAAAAVWGSAVTYVDGVGLSSARSAHPRGYLAGLASVRSPGDYLSHFTQRISSYPTHVQGHPPGTVMALWLLSRLHLRGAGLAVLLAIVAILVGAAAVPAVLLTARALVGEGPARTAVPFLVFAPTAVWAVTSADGVYTAVAAWAAALMSISLTRSKRSDLLAALGGLLFGVTLFLSYGLVLIAVIPLLVAWSRRRIRPLFVAAAGAGVVFVLFAGGGFFWWEGLRATMHAYHARDPRLGPYAFFVVANLAAFALALGPAAAAGVARLRLHSLWPLVGGAIVAIAAADVSALSKGEVERIWLPFAPWILLATASLHPRARRAWLGGQVALTLALQIGVRTRW